MRFTEYEKEKWIQKNADEYGRLYAFMDFLPREEAKSLLEQRDRLLQRLEAKGVVFGFGATKADMRNLARCFYCPCEQNQICDPATNTLTFPDPDDYVAYLRMFGFQGASISGGEPFLTWDRTLAYLQKIKEGIPSIYLWLYTNGKLADEEKLRLLAKTGLDEIRFNLGAVDYNLDKVALATKIIPRVTIEIPAVPGDAEKLKSLVHDLERLGVRHFNLHQLRATPYSVGKFLDRGLTFLHGTKVLAAYSEITALRTMEYILEQNLALPLNYCSFLYKSTYQSIASRKRSAALALEPDETITSAGYVRKRVVSENPRRITISYAEVLLQETPTSSSYQEFFLPTGKKVFLCKRPLLSPIALQGQNIELFERLFLQPEKAPSLFGDDQTFEEELAGEEVDLPFWLEIHKYERIRGGFVEYF